MENIVKKYQLEQGNKKYNLSTQIYQDKLRFVCIEINSISPLVYTGEYAFDKLMQLNDIFSSISTISQAQDILDNIIVNEKVNVESQGNFINLNIIIKNENQIEKSFTIKLNLYTQNENNNEQTVINQSNNTNHIDNQISTSDQMNLYTQSIMNNEQTISQPKNENNFNFQQDSSNINLLEQNMTNNQPSISQNIENQINFYQDTSNHLSFNEATIGHGLASSPNFENQINLNQETSNQQFLDTNNTAAISQPIISQSSLDNQLNTQVDSANQLHLFNQNTTTNTQPIISQSNPENQINIPENSANIFFSFSENINNGSNAVNYSSTENTFHEQQYTHIPKNKSNGNMMENAMSNNYTYENVQTTKTKRKRVDKLTLSLRAMPENEEKQRYYKQWRESLSPQRKEEETEVIQTTTSFIPQQSIQINPQPIIQQTEIDRNVKIFEIENLKSENNKLNDIIRQLRSQIETLIQENNNLKLNNNIPNGNEAQEILFLKDEIERYLREIDLLRNQLKGFEEYKRIKEEEIKFLKVQLEETINNFKRMEEYAIQKEKEIEELKIYIEELIRKQNVPPPQYQSFSSQNQINKIDLEDQMLLIQDTRLEIVKGDIISNVRELEFLTRKMNKNNKKVSLDLLYKASVDGDKAEIFHKKCDTAKSSLVLVKSENGKRFGGYTTCDWAGNSIEKKDDNAFVFSLDKMKIYEIIPGEDAIGCYPKYGPVFLGCQIRIYDEFFSKGGTTFEKGLNYSTQEDYELTGGMKKFGIKEVEVYSVELE